jgi:glycosyltransferase involved in cell wall biosynthesis
VKQRDCDVKVLVADSGSTDGTLDICRRWGVEHVYVEPGNMYSAVNAGLRTLNCEWVTYLNSDDVVFPDSYARLLALAEKTHASVAYGTADYVDASGRFLFSHTPPRPKMLRPLHRLGVMGFAQPGAIFSRSAFETANAFDESFHNAADFAFFSRLLEAGERFARLPSPAVCSFRLHVDQFSVRAKARVEEERQRVTRSVCLPANRRDHLSMWFWRAENTFQYTERFLRSRRLHSQF